MTYQNLEADDPEHPCIPFCKQLIDTDIICQYDLFHFNEINERRATGSISDLQ